VAVELADESLMNKVWGCRYRIWEALLADVCMECIDFSASTVKNFVVVGVVV